MIAPAQEPAMAGVEEFLPRLAEEDVLPEVGGLRVDDQGYIGCKPRHESLYLTYEHDGQKISVRLTKDAQGSISLEFSAAVLHLPAIADPTRRRALIDRLRRLRLPRGCRIGLAPDYSIYLQAKFALPQTRMTTRWFIAQLTYATLALEPTLSLFKPFNVASAPTGA